MSAIMAVPMIHENTTINRHLAKRLAGSRNPATRASLTIRNSLLVLVALSVPLLTLLATNRLSLLNFWDDWRWHLPANSTGSEVLVVDIDENSLATLGRWPWPRDLLDRLLTGLLEQHQVAVVGVDIILSDANTQADKAAFSALDRQRIIWAHAISLAPEAAVSQGVLTSAPPCPANSPWLLPVNGWLGLSPDIAGNDFRAGHIRPWPDSDQVIRVYMPFLSVDQRCVPALALAMYASIMGMEPNAALSMDDQTWLWDGIPLGLEPNGTLRLKWNFDRIRSVSAAEVLAGTASIPAGSTVLVGSTALGIGDFVKVPSVARFAGVGVHALALRQWLDRDFVIKPSYHDSAVYAALFGVFWLFWFASRRTTLLLWLAGVAIFVLWNLICYGFWLKNIYVAAEPMLWALFWLPGIQVYRLWQEKRARNIIYQQFHSYLPEKVLQELIDSQVDPQELAAQSREVTVLFADIQGFTTISENMEPVEVVSMLNAVMEYLSNHIAHHNGTLDKFMGDGVMAFWGAPVPMENHANDAIECAVGILADLEQLNAELDKLGLPSVQLGIGINSGQVAVGHMGSISRKNYTCVGDVVNIASRLQQMCSSLECNLLLGGDAAGRSHGIDLVKIRDIHVKGKKNQVAVYTHLHFQPA